MCIGNSKNNSYNLVDNMDSTLYNRINRGKKGSAGKLEMPRSFYD